MRDIWIIMKFTIKDMVKRKSFIISTLVILAFIVIGFNIPNIISWFGNDNIKSKILVVDNDNIFEGSLDSLNNMDINYEVTLNNLELANVKEKIENGDYDSALYITKEDNNIKIDYIIPEVSVLDSIPSDLVSILETLYKNVQIAKLNLTTAELQSISPNFEYSLVGISEEAAGNVIVMMLLSIVLFYAIYFCAYQVSSSITIEKTSKIIETLVTSTSPKNIVLGKTLGIGLVGMLQMILIVGTALISANIFMSPEILSMVLDVSNITLGLGIITVMYFVLGYLTYALIYAVTGSTVSKPEDVQSANGPVAILSVGAFYLSYFTMMNPSGNLNVFASLFPLSSPFCMPFRVMMGLATTTDVLLSMVILIISILLIAKVAIKIYSNAILNYGTKLSFKDLISIYKEKNK